MVLNNKLRELRMARNMTQEAVAAYLMVSAQTVSKWERGLLSPDISQLPKIALLFKCSIDSLFDMNRVWSVEHRKEFVAQIQALHAKQDWEGVYEAWMREIDLNPDHYGNYADVMLHVYRKKLYDKDRVQKMISLAEHAEKCCTDDDRRNEIYRIMLQLCSESDDPVIKEKGKYYYRKLPSLRHSREVYANFVMQGEAYRAQVKRTLIYQIDGAECCIRQLITEDMSPEEKLFYYQRAAALYEAVLDDKYAGFYDPPLLSNYRYIAETYMQLQEYEKAREYVYRIFAALEKHMDEAQRQNTSRLLCATVLKGAATGEEICKGLLKSMVASRDLEPFRDEILKMQKRYNEYFLQ